MAGSQERENLNPQSREVVKRAGVDQASKVDSLTQPLLEICQQADSAEDALSKMIEHGFPAGLISFMKAEMTQLVELIITKLKTGEGKPELMQSLVVAAQKQVIQFFELKRTSIERYFQAANAPAETAESLNSVLAGEPLDNLTDKQLLSLAEASVSIAESARERALQILVQRVKDFLERELGIKVYKIEKSKEYHGLFYNLGLFFKAGDFLEGEVRSNEPGGITSIGL